ncbi:MAG: metallophosphoesterase [Cyanobacteria bacterium HKST-UBA02]|nr:metallophosphoesterase [Cyanobacteria bacterium HKST-UBA02]
MQTDFNQFSPVVTFIVKPYLQMGQGDFTSRKASLALIWHADETAADWGVQVAAGDSDDFHDAGLVYSREMRIAGIKKHHRFRVDLTGLESGKIFKYRILYDGKAVFGGRSRAPVPAGSSFEAVLVGDLFDAGPVASRIEALDPDLTVFAGDIVYKHGQFGDYLEQFFPAFGGLLAHRLAVAAVGNHDVSAPRELFGFKSKKKEPDLFAYRFVFDQRRNGPVKPGKDCFDFSGDAEKYRRSYKIVGREMLSQTCFSFKYGNAFFLVLDGNRYVDWSRAELRQWVSDRLEEGRDSAWRFVVIHQPPFTCDVTYLNENRSRLLCDLFQAHGVDVVFSGHSHMYERSHPLIFEVQPQADGSMVGAGGSVRGAFTLDRQFDGREHTRPRGIVYITTGRGGKPLDLDHQPDSANLPEYLKVLDLDDLSVTSLSVADRELVIRQVSTSGRIIDEFRITR